MLSVVADRRSAVARRDLRLSAIAVLLGLSAFGLYGVTTQPLVQSGYENETAAVSEGLVQTGQPRVRSGTALGMNLGVPGRGGHLYGRTGLTQPLLEVPVYWLGEKLDRLAGDGRSDRWRLTLLQLYDPAMAALTVAAIFLLLSLRGLSARRSLAMAAMCAVATLIWPYSKIGMDTTLMAMLALAVLAAAWAARRPTTGRLGLAGLAIALTVNSKAYGALLLLGTLPLFLPTFKLLVGERRVRPLAAVAVPVACGLAALAWYNWYRTGSITSFGDAYYSQRLFAMPISALGLLISPGKGLLLYSPLVVLGLAGLRVMWRADRPLARAVLIVAVLNIGFVATSIAWTDETWGPRYLLPSAWLLVLPVAWWATDRRRLRWVAAVALVAACVQFVGVFASYGVDIAETRVLAGEPVYLYGHDGARVAYGDDGPRWIPQASPLLFQLELLAAYAKEKLTGSGFTVTYKPWRGNQASIDLSHPEQNFGPLPDFWWIGSGTTAKQELVAALLALLALGSATTIVRQGRSPSGRPASAPG